MCGRVVRTSSAQELAAMLYADVRGVEDIRPSYNVAPRQEMLVVRERRTDDGIERVLSPMRWGLIPSFATDPRIGDRQINTRAETIATKGPFRHAFARKRCIIPVDDFYEWKTVGPAATPKAALRDALDVLDELAADQGAESETRVGGSR